MWLIDTTTLKLKEFLGVDCKYAILSHTWEKDEVSFQEMLAEPRPARLLEKAGFLKIKKTCEVAKARRYTYAWVDTCCIDKTSSAALSEAINSMFRWYKESSLCLAYLSDLRANVFELPESNRTEYMKGCRWFTRGWTLQELIAPEDLDFYDQEWNFWGSKKILRHDLSKITGIDAEILEDAELLPTVPVGQRMSWAANRKTTRLEDTAYCLFGIFDVYMPMIYGEGKNSFLRLQEEIVMRTNDLTLFAWTCQHDPGVDERSTHASQNSRNLRGIFAQSPSEFVDCSSLKISRERLAPIKEFAMTNNGLRIETTLGSSPDGEYILPLDCVDEKKRKLGIYLRRMDAGFIRDRAYGLFSTSDKTFFEGQRSPIYIERTMSNSLSLRLTQLFRTLNFHFTMDTRENHTVQSINVRPASLWDENDRLFIIGNRQDFTACIEYKLKPLWWRFVIVCGLIDARAERPRVSDLWEEEEEEDNNYDGFIPWMAIFTDQDPAAKPQLEIIDKLKNTNDELRKLRSTVLSWYTDAHNRLPLRKMAEARKTAFDDNGTEITYHLSMIKEPRRKGTPIFNIRVFVHEVHRDHESSTMGEVRSEEETEYARARLVPERVSQPPPVDRDPPAPPRPQSYQVSKKHWFSFAACSGFKVCSLEFANEFELIDLADTFVEPPSRNKDSYSMEAA